MDKHQLTTRLPASASPMYPRKAKEALLLGMASTHRPPPPACGGDRWKEKRRKAAQVGSPQAPASVGGGTPQSLRSPSAGLGAGWLALGFGTQPVNGAPTTANWPGWSEGLSLPVVVRAG